MKRTFLIGMILIAVNYSSNAGLPKMQLSGQNQKESVQKSVYTCSMHPDVISDKAGKCPKCGMNLIVKEITKEVYACPMHAEVKSDTTGKCTKCGMNLVKQEQPEKVAKRK